MWPTASRFPCRLAERAFAAQAMPQLSMGCGVFLQSDIVNQQRKGWQADEILAGLCGILPLNVWIYAGGLQNLGQVGKEVHPAGRHPPQPGRGQGAGGLHPGPHSPEADIVVHPSLREAGAIGAALVARHWWRAGGKRALPLLRGRSRASSTAPTTSVDTVCHWCPVSCQRTFIDVALPGAAGMARGASLPLAEGWERVIVNNSCPKGLLEDASEVRWSRSRWSGPGTPSRTWWTLFARKRSAPLLLGRPATAAVRVGIPRVLNVWNTHQFWLGFLAALGIPRENVVFSSDTSEDQGRDFGKGRGSVDCCYPVKCMSGHYGELLFGQRRKSTCC